MGEDRRRHHAEADAEERLVRHVVARLERLVLPLVGAGQLPAAVGARAADPAEAGVEAGRPPRLGRGQLALLFGRVDLLEQRDVVVALAPDERLLGGLGLGVGVEERRALRPELLEGGLDHGSALPGARLARSRYRSPNLIVTPSASGFDGSLQTGYACVMSDSHLDPDKERKRLDDLEARIEATRHDAEGLDPANDHEQTFAEAGEIGEEDDDRNAAPPI